MFPGLHPTCHSNSKLIDCSKYDNKLQLPVLSRVTVQKQLHVNKCLSQAAVTLTQVYLENIMNTGRMESVSLWIQHISDIYKAPTMCKALC